jgi:type VI secretion system FHA domain protein
MSIILNVETYKGQPPAEPIIVTFDRESGTIGRSRKNNFVLPDPDRYISRRHATILYDNQVYFLEDSSLSGSHIRNRNIRLHKNKAELYHGDLIEIGEYLISVDLKLLEKTEQVSDIEKINENDHLDLDNEMELSAYDKVEKSGTDIDAGTNGHKKYTDFEAVVQFVNEKMEKVISHQDLDPSKRQSSPYEVELSGNESVAYENDLEKPLLTIPKGIDLDKLLTNIQIIIKSLPSILPPDKYQAFQTELNQSLGNNIKGTTDLITRDKKTQSDQDQKSHHTSQPLDEILQLFLYAMGIKDLSRLKNEEVPDLMQTAGAIFRELIQGLMALITGRAETKKQLRLKGTILGPTDNNPLKFSSNIEDTIKVLLGPKQYGFVSGIQAVRESYADIMSHQIAMTVGIQRALKKTLKKFDPKPYTRKYKKNPSFLQKSKCWDDYCKDYQTIVIKSLEDFLDEEFIKAYEEQIEKLSKS